MSLRHPAAWQTIPKSALRFPLVVKPTNASHAQGASLNILTSADLHQAVERAFAYNKKYKKGNRVLIEEYFHGFDLRFLVIGNQVASVVKREPAYVIGDGKRTIRQLIHEFNEKWRSPIKYDLPLCPIPIDYETSRCLARRKLTIDTVLSKNRKVHVRWNANVSTGGRASDVTNKVHPKLKQLAIRVAKLSHLEIGGVDILCKDYASEDISEDSISILEINDSPGFDIHHFPVEGSGQEIATDILDYIFGATSSEREERSAKHIEQLLKNLPLNIPSEMPGTEIRTPMSLKGEIQ